mgnify:FL=1
MLVLKKVVREHFGLRDLPTYHAWCARRAMGLPDYDDASLCELLIDERLAGQRDDGAWGAEDGSPIETARMLRELGDLGISGDHPDVQVAVAWLLERPRLIYNPGQWFRQDILVAEQVAVVAQRAAIMRGGASAVQDAAGL